MNKRIHSLWLLVATALLSGVVTVSLQAQQSNPHSPDTPATQQPSQAQPQPGQSAPDAQDQSQRTDVQTFSGTIVKSGDRFMLQDADGKTFDIDNQGEAKKHEGKQVTIKGTLDPDGKTIHVK